MMTARVLIATLVGVLSFILLLPAYAVTVVLVGVACAVRSISRFLEPPYVPWTELIVFDQRLGWRPKPRLDVHYLAEHDDVFRMVTDGEGWPGRHSLDESEVVVIGDSFAAGYGVDTNKSFAGLNASPKIKAVGAPGYSMVHGVLLMEQFGRRLHGKLVVWFVYLENDLQDNLAPEMRQYRAPFVRPNGTPGQWMIVDQHIAPDRWQCSNSDVRRLFPRLCVPGPLADRAYSACQYLIERAARACDAAGGTLVVVTIPHPMQLTETGKTRLATLSGAPERCDAELPDRRIAESCSRAGIPMVAAKKYLTRSDYKSREGIHWNERGHRRVARLVQSLYGSFQAGTFTQSLSPVFSPLQQIAVKFEA
jgi:hypothetical protein